MDPQIKTTEPMVSTKVTNCRILSSWILGPDGFAKNYTGSRPEPKKIVLFNLWSLGFYFGYFRILMLPETHMVRNTLKKISPKFQVFISILTCAPQGCKFPITWSFWDGSINFLFRPKQWFKKFETL